MDTTTIHDIDSVEKLLKMTKERLEKSMLDNVRPFREEWKRVEGFCCAAADALSSITGIGGIRLRADTEMFLSIVFRAALKDDRFEVAMKERIKEVFDKEEDAARKSKLAGLMGMVKALQELDKQMDMDEAAESTKQ